MESVLEVGRDNQQLSAKSQSLIDSTERQTDKIVNEWKAVSKQVEGLKLYNAQKRIQIQAQLDLMDKLDEQLVQVVVMQRQIPPLAQRMLESLESFINLDTPFRFEERQNRDETPCDNVQIILQRSPLTPKDIQLFVHY